MTDNPDKTVQLYLSPHPGGGGNLQSLLFCHIHSKKKNPEDQLFTDLSFETCLTIISNNTVHNL